MKKGVSISIAFVLSFVCVFLFVISGVSAYTVELHNYNSTLTGVRIVNATDLYSYEINFVITDAAPGISFDNALKANGQETTNGNSTELVQTGVYILSVYESILDATGIGVNITNRSAFNITHTGNITARMQLNVYSALEVQTDESLDVYVDPVDTLRCTSWSTCSINGYKTRQCTSPTCHYWAGLQSEQEACTPAVDNVVVDNGRSGGGSGSGGGSSTQALNIEFGNPDIQESGKVSVPVTLKNGGTVGFNNIELTGFLKKNGEVLTDIPVGLSKTSIVSLAAGKSESITVTANIKENDVNFYELVIQAKSTSPAYEVANKVLFTFVGVEGGKVLKVVAFTSGLIDEHPECLELKDMITEAQNEFNNGDTQAALQKANQAVEACKSYLESPLKPVISQKQYDRIPLYLGIGIAGAILLRIVFNVYRSYVFRRKFR